MAAIGDAQSVGRCLKHLFQKLQADLGALLIFASGFEKRRQRTGLFRARTVRGGTRRFAGSSGHFQVGHFHGRMNKRRWSSALQRFLQPAGAGKLRPS